MVLKIKSLYRGSILKPFSIEKSYLRSFQNLNINNYKEYCDIVKPDVISIDYDVNPSVIRKNIKIPIQGGLNPKILLSDKITLKKETIKYLEIFKDHPYIFNLGHGVMPQTKTNMVDYLVKLVRDYK